MKNTLILQDERGSPYFASNFSHTPDPYDSSSPTTTTTTTPSDSPLLSALKVSSPLDGLLLDDPFNKYPDQLCITLNDIKFNQPRGRFFLRISYLTEVKKTVPDKDLSAHLSQTFMFDCSFHSILFDVVKIDIYEHRTIGTNVHLGRTVVPLADLLHSSGELAKAYPNRLRRSSSTPTPAPTSTTGPESDAPLATSETEISVTLKLLNKKVERRKQTMQRSVSLPFGTLDRFDPLDQTTLTSSSNPRLSRSPSISTVASQNTPSPPAVSCHSLRSVPRSPRGIHTAVGRTVSTPVSSTSSFYGSENDDWTEVSPTEECILKAIAEEEEEDNLDDTLCEVLKKKGPKFRIISEETKTVLKECNAIYNAYFKSGWQISKLEFMSAALVLQKYYTKQPILLTHVRPTETKPLEQILHYLKFSMASYGSAIMNMWGQGAGVKDAIRVQSDRKAVCEICKLDPEQDMIKWQFGKNQVCKPKYYICRDPETNAIVVVLRGTLNIHDVVTDLNCHYEPFQGGLVHKGILRCAQSVIEESLDVMKEAVKKFNATGLYFVGHSLGGAVASVACLMIRDLLREFQSLTTETNFDILTFAMGPPPSVSLDITTHGKQCVYSVVNEFDLFSRLSYGSCIVLKEIIKGIVEAKKDPLLRKMTKKARNHHITEMIDAHRTHWLHEKSHTKLFIPGNIYYLYKAKNAKLGPLPSKEMRSQIHVEVSRPEHFVDLILRNNAITHHLPFSYDKSLKATLTWLAATDGLPKRRPALR